MPVLARKPELIPGARTSARCRVDPICKFGRARE